MPHRNAPNGADEIDFLKVCLQHYKEPLNKANFDFDAVATKMGFKDGQAAYKKFWSIKQKWGLGGGKAPAAETSVGTGVAKTATSVRAKKTGASSKKRTAAGKMKNEDESSPAGGTGGTNNDSGKTLVGCETTDEDTEIDELETPSKKPKTESE